MIFHKIDYLVSLAIHLIPLVTSWNLRWHTMEWERATLPENQRYFLTPDEDEIKNGGLWRYLIRMFFIPLALYLTWVGLYSLKVFVISSKRIKERNYETLYVYYMNQAWAA